MDHRTIKKKKSTLKLFQEADASFKKSVKTLIDFTNTEPALSKENKLAIVSGLFAPQWIKNVKYNEMRIALVRACWEKMCIHPKNNVAVRQAINDLTRFAFYAQRNKNFGMLSMLTNICHELTLEEPILEPNQAQIALRYSSWKTNKAIALVLAKPGEWQKMSKMKNLIKNNRLWR